ncbi:MAG: hypothetical protein KC517_12075 [Bacteroidetes bacterium]|nr:hypothetical protein [Bacteroidota bacterium]
MRSYTYYLVIGLFLLSSCGNPKTDLLSKIENLTTELSENQSGQGRAELANLQASYVDAYPTDSVSKAYLENISFFYLMVDSTALAKKYANQYLSQYPEDKNANDIALVVAKAELKEGNYKVAVEAFESVQQNTMLSVTDMRSLSEALLALAQDDDIDGNDVYYFKHAAILEQTQGMQASIDALSVFHTKYPASTIGPSVMMVYADKLEKNGDIDEAKSVLNLIMSQYPESSQAATAKSMIDNELVGLTAEEQLEKILQNKSSN